MMDKDSPETSIGGQYRLPWGDSGIAQDETANGVSTTSDVSDSTYPPIWDSQVL